MRQIEEAPAREDLARRIEEAFDEELLQQATESVQERIEYQTWEAFRLTALERLSGAEASRRGSAPGPRVAAAWTGYQMGVTEAGQAPRYREIARLGTGGMARVTLAEDTLLGRKVALKRVYASGDPTGMARLKREALLGASLNHPNLVAVYDAQIREDGDVVLVMEYVPGETLRDVISARGALEQHLGQVDPGLAGQQLGADLVGQGHCV